MSERNRDEEFEGLIIRKDRLFKKFWVKPVWIDDDPDKGVISEGYYSEEDVTDKLPIFLGHTCRIQKGTTLRDFFKLLNNHKEILSVLQKTNWFAEYIEAGLKAPLNVVDNDDLKIDYLEVYAYLDHSESEYCDEDDILEMKCAESDEVWKEVIHKKGETTDEDTNLSHGFHGMSKPLTKEYVEQNNPMYNKNDIGKVIPIGFFGSEIDVLMDLELRICHTLTVSNWKPYSKKWKSKKWTNYYSFNLFDIIDAVFFELSFNGSPEDSEKKKNELLETIKNIK